MTYKSIIENIVEREARHALEKKTNIRVCGFGKVEFQNNSKTFLDFRVALKEFGKPWTIIVVGYIDDLGFISLVHYKYDDGATVYDLTAKKD